MFRARHLVFACLLAFTGCSSTTSSGSSQTACTSNSQCVGGDKCIAGVCVDAKLAGSCVPLASTTAFPQGLTSVDIADGQTPTNCANTVQPGADLDAVGLYRYFKDAPCAAGQAAGYCLVAVARAGSARVVGNPVCSVNEHDDPHQIEGPRDASTTNPDGGWFSLNGRTVEFELAGCKGHPLGELDIAHCDGRGDPVLPQPGDELDVFEVDSWYTDSGWRARTCKCVADDYQVQLRSGADGFSICLGVFHGTTSHIRVHGDPR